MISERVSQLREQSVKTRPSLSAERAQLITEFYRSLPHMFSVPVARALGFKYILEHKTIYIGDRELIVGERGPAPQATPTYPELCCHKIEDLDIMNSRKRQPFSVARETRTLYQENIIPFWKGRSMRERIFSAVSEDWVKAYSAGIFTEFMEQRAPGHAVLDDKIYYRGLTDFKDEIKARLVALDYFADPQAYQKEQQLKAMEIAADAVISFAQRHAVKAQVLAASESDPERRKELETIAKVCAHVPAFAPRTFWEAIQMYWFLHLGVIIELNVWDSFNPGRLDQHLYPFYKKDVRKGILSKEGAEELLQCLWIKVNNQAAPPKVEITEEQSSTYQDFALINIGGITKNGEDAVNELSYVLLDVVEEMRLIQPSACIQLSSKNPDRFLKRALEVVKAGFGQPSLFNTDVIIQEFLRAGKSLRDARAGGPSGCVTISAFGKESCTLTGYLNWPKILEITLHNGYDVRTKTQIGIKTDTFESFSSFEQLMDAFNQQLQYFLDLKIKHNNIIERLYAAYMPAPFMSLLIDDCLATGRDYHDGGPRYNTTYIQGVGLGTATDSLSALKYWVFDKKVIPLRDLLKALKSDFNGYESVRRTLQDAPSYGNDDDYADAVAQSVFDSYVAILDGRPNTKGGNYRVNLLPTTVHIYFGKITGATPNGRKEGAPLSDGISPSQGADIHGPTAVIKSAAKIDHTRTGGTLLNLKFIPQLLEGEGIDKLAHLVRAYFRMGGHHIQFNVVDTDTLKKAQESPQDYQDLIVRVAGYSDYFVNIGKELQDEIIKRTAHQRF